ncbi:cobalamin biosynthesis protein [Chloroflexota bacterium]
MEMILILFLALAIDLALGEPPRVIHPVVWMGKVTSFLERGNHRRSHTIQFSYGVAMVIITMVLFTAPAYFILRYLKELDLVVYMIAGAVFLKPTFSLKELRLAALRVKILLLEDKLDKARFELRSLVSRDTHGLPGPLLVSATVESVAEGTGDSFIAPLFYFLLLGIPGAIAYRVVNTLDAMIGYHGKYEYLGKFASRLDDVLNFIPARLAALLLVLAAFLLRKDGRASWQVALSEHAKTESPNAGWPMAAVAGGLNVRLEKVEHYQLGKTSTSPLPETIDDTLGLAQTAMLAWVLICLMIGVIRFVITS